MDTINKKSIFSIERLAKDTDNFKKEKWKQALKTFSNSTTSNKRKLRGGILIYIFNTYFKGNIS